MFTILSVDLNTEHTKELVRPNENEELLEYFRELISCGGGPIRNMPGFSLRVVEQQALAIACLDYEDEGCEPLTFRHYFLCATNAVLSLAAWSSVGDAFKEFLEVPLDIPRPERTPWLAEFSSLAALEVNFEFPRLELFSQCLAWALYDHFYEGC